MVLLLQTGPSLVPLFPFPLAGHREQTGLGVWKGRRRFPQRPSEAKTERGTAEWLPPAPSAPFLLTTIRCASSCPVGENGLMSPLRGIPLRPLAPHPIAQLLGPLLLKHQEPGAVTALWVGAPRRAPKMARQGSGLGCAVNQPKGRHRQLGKCEITVHLKTTRSGEGVSRWQRQPYTVPGPAVGGRALSQEGGRPRQSEQVVKLGFVPRTQGL